MEETLRQKQSRFMVMQARLVLYITEQGYDTTGGDLYRDPRTNGVVGVKLGYGHPKSAHKNRLAIDINLFKDGVFLETTEAHEQFGVWWEAQAPDARWGGRFNDGNHYSIEVDGIR